MKKGHDEYVYLSNKYKTQLFDVAKAVDKCDHYRKITNVHQIINFKTFLKRYELNGFDKHLIRQLLILKYRDYDYYLSWGIKHVDCENELFRGLQRITSSHLIEIIQIPHDFSSVEYFAKFRKIQEEVRRKMRQENMTV